MRITHETLIKIAQETTEQRVDQDRDLVAVLLTGSLLGDEPLLGGTTDIDLVFIHGNAAPVEREIVRLTDEIHLDILHQSQSLFQHPRQMRIDPWLGSLIYAHPMVLHDTQHWFEFTQASVSSQFWRPEYTIGRARAFAEPARRVWMEYHEKSRHEPNQALSPIEACAYLDTLQKAANAVASLSAPPLTTRRFLLQFPLRAQAITRPQLSHSFLEAFETSPVEVEAIQGWLPAWKEAFSAAAAIPTVQPSLHPCRIAYYQRAIEAYLEQSLPEAALWPLIYTWTKAIHTLPAHSKHRQAWQAACDLLSTGAERWQRLDGFLDRVEECLDAWSAENGI
jgi:hypothetical protein